MERTEDLSQGDAPIAWGNLLMSVHVESCLRKATSRAPRQQVVLKATAGEHDSRTAERARAIRSASSANALWNRAEIVASARSRRRCSAMIASIAPASPRRQLGRRSVGWRTLADSALIGQKFELHGGVSLKSHLFGESTQGSHAVEQPSHTAGAREQPRPL